MTPNEGGAREPTQNASHFPFLKSFFDAFLHDAETPICTQVRSFRQEGSRPLRSGLPLTERTRRVAEKKLRPFLFFFSLRKRQL